MVQLTNSLCVQQNSTKLPAMLSLLREDEKMTPKNFTLKFRIAPLSTPTDCRQQGSTLNGWPIPQGNRL